MVFNFRSAAQGRRLVGAALASAFFFSTACDDSAGSASPSPDPTNQPDAGGEDVFSSGVEIAVDVPATGRVHVSLADQSVVEVAEPASSGVWDLAFEGYDVFCNGGASGSGSSAVFGPLDAIAFVGDVAPAAPFLAADRAGGAFLQWFFYEGAPAHALWSRFHVFGVKDGDRLWKVQILGYYGQRDGAPVSALYAVRYAEIFADGRSPSPTIELSPIDGTAGGPQGAASEPSECLDLGTGARAMLTPAEAATSHAWHLCFRRQSISVSGDLGGPRGVGAVDLDAAAIAGETLAGMKERTPESEAARFDAVTAASFDGRVFRGDRIVSAFSDVWIDPAASPRAPAHAAWLVLGADGVQKYLVGFRAFEGPTDVTPGKIMMRIKPVKG